MPIVLIPGVYENWQFLQPIAERLYEKGYAVHVLEKLKYNTGSIPDMADIVRAYLDEHNLSDVIIIAHSKGGLIAKYAMSKQSGIEHIRHVIAINSPFSGSKYAYFFLLPSIRTFTPHNKIITLLSQNEQLNRKITSIYSEFDPHIPGGSQLPGAVNIIVPTVGHFRPLSDPQVLRHITRIINEKEKEKL